MNAMLAPSMMCVDPFYLAETVSVFEKNGIEALHMDVMDGHFVPNLQLGTDYCRAVRAHTALPLDYHLMVEAPEDKLGWFPIQAGDFVSVHAESTRHLQLCVDRIAALGAKPLLALNPGTPLCMAEESLPKAAGLLLMTVNPGFAGQKLVESTIDKIRRARQFLDALGRTDAIIEVDGNVSPANFVRMRQAGADLFVIGTSGFLKERDPQKMQEGIAYFRSL